MTAVSTQQTPPPPTASQHNPSAAASSQTPSGAQSHGPPADIMLMRSGPDGSPASVAVRRGANLSLRGPTAANHRHAAVPPTDERSHPSLLTSSHAVSRPLDSVEATEAESYNNWLPKPPLHRSKSASRSFDDSEPDDEMHNGWGARHGFEDHYQSEHIISQLASVC